MDKCVDVASFSAFYPGHFIYSRKRTHKKLLPTVRYDVKCFHKEGCRISLMHYLSLLIRNIVLYLPTGFSLPESRCFFFLFTIFNLITAIDIFLITDFFFACYDVSFIMSIKVKFWYYKLSEKVGRFWDLSQAISNLEWDRHGFESGFQTLTILFTSIFFCWNWNNFSNCIIFGILNKSVSLFFLHINFTWNQKWK